MIKVNLLHPRSVCGEMADAFNDREAGSGRGVKAAEERRDSKVILFDTTAKNGQEECWVCGGSCAFGRPAKKGEPLSHKDPHMRPDWTRECEVCGKRPVVPATKMCGPCSFGEAKTAGGDW
jgi:ribosomal protein L37E